MNAELPPLAPLPEPFKYCSPGKRFRDIAKVEFQYRKYELERGHNIKAIYQDQENGVVLVCVAQHRKCPYHVSAEPATHSEGWRIQSSPFCVTHNHPPLYPLGTSPVNVPPLSNPPPFTDFVYSINPALSQYMPRLEAQGWYPEYRPESLRDLLEDDGDLESLLIGAGMTLAHRKAFLLGLRKGLERRKADLAGMGLAEDADTDEDYYMDGSLAIEGFEKMISDVLEKTLEERRTEAEKRGLLNAVSAS